MAVHHLGVEPGTVHGRFSRDIPPLLTIDPGDAVTYQTLDSSWGFMGQEWFDRPPPDVGRDPERDQGHALTGPVAIRGTVPGDVLEIQIMDIRPGQWGWTWAGPMKNRPRDYGALTDEAGIGWTLDADGGAARDIHGHGVTVPLRPFMGVMGNAPAAPGDHSTTPPRRVGGNLDCRELVAGSTLWLPIEAEGALFSVGDGHGAQGDGEIGSTAIECPMEHVSLTFQVRRNMTISGPQARTPGGFLTMGLGDTLDEAASQAIAAMLDHLQATYAWKRAEAAVFAAVAVDLGITQVVNTVVGVHALLPNDALRRD